MTKPEYYIGEFNVGKIANHAELAIFSQRVS
jgi:hypothetical protein